MTKVAGWLALGLAVLAPPALAAPPTVPWTSVGSAGIVDESSLQAFVFTGACASLHTVRAAVAPESAELRYNVTDTFDNGANPPIPGWSVFEMGYVAPSGTQVVASLMLVQPCTGKERTICRIVSQPASRCLTCRFDPTLVNFDKALYYIDVRLTRNDSLVPPRVCTLRLK